MATLTTIPTQPGEVIRVLLTLAANAGSDIIDIRSSNDNCTLVGDAIFNAQLSLDGINPLGNAGNQIRLRRSGSIGFNGWQPSNATVRLKFASSADADAVLDGTHLSVGGGYWNWQLSADPASQSGGGTINVVMWIPLATKDTAGAVTAGAPSMTASAEKVATSAPRDVSAHVAAGVSSLMARAEAVPAGDVDAAACVSAGAPRLTARAERVAVMTPIHDAAASWSTGAPVVAVLVERVGPGATTAIHRVIFTSSLWVPRTNPTRAVMSVTVGVEGAAEDICPALCRELSRRLDYYEFGVNCCPSDAAPHGTVTPSAAEHVKGGIVISTDPNQSEPIYEDGDPEPSYSEARLQISQGTTRDLADLELFIERRADLRRVLGNLNGDIGA